MPNQLIFVDESAANERTSHRKYGWLPKGVRPHENIPFERSERWSVLPAYTVNGFLTWDIEHGSFTQEVILYLIHLDRVVWGSKQLHQTGQCWHSEPGTLAEGTLT